MKKRMKFFLYILISVFLLSIILVIYYDRKLSPIIMEYSVAETKKIISIIINRSINGDLLSRGDIEHLYTVMHGENGDIITLNSFVVNQLTDLISDACEDNLLLVEEEKFDLLKEKFHITRNYFMVPSGLIFGNGLLSSFGYSIPINLRILGNLSSNVNSEVKEYGLNNSLITISITITVEVMIILPFNSKVVTFVNDVPISIKLIQGKIPQIYGLYK